MARLIDAEPYDELLKQRSEQLRDEMGSLGGAVSGCRKLLAIQPTVDAVEVVRCKDCKHCLSDAHGLWCFRDYEYNLQPDDFCSHGERRADNGN